MYFFLIKILIKKKIRKVFKILEEKNIKIKVKAKNLREKNLVCPCYCYHRHTYTRSRYEESGHLPTR